METAQYEAHPQETLTAASQTGPKEMSVAPPPASPPSVPAPVRVTVDHLTSLPESAEKREWIDALVRAELARLHYSQDVQLARDAYASGQFDDLKKLTPQQGVALALMKMQIGRDWGFTRADSLRHIAFINGKPSAENELVAAKLQAAGYSWEPEFLYEEVQHKGKPFKKCVGCLLWVSRWNPEAKRYVALTDRNGEQVSVGFTQAEAEQAKVWEGGKQIALSEKWNFQAWPKDMYYWRSIGRLKKYYAAGVMRGAVLRDEALEMMPVEGTPPELLPADLQPGTEPASGTSPRPSLRDRVMGQPSFLEAEEPDHD